MSRIDYPWPGAGDEFNKKWEDQSIKERIISSINHIERKKAFNFPDGVPIDLMETDINRYNLWQMYESQLALLNSLLKGC